MAYEYIFFFSIYFFITALLVFLMILLILIFSPRQPSYEKLTIYECGFKPFDLGYFPFDVHFYRVGILFLLFDVEILYLFPWVVNFYYYTFYIHRIIVLFIYLLLLGFLYELSQGALNWYPTIWNIPNTTRSEFIL
jgi:NADH-quinone oxidoreductase subunit A